mmetsp:Transcript_24536/g.56557  ORF Transcript_24536/g.56557 Transcript_24536/m.56557 type:complete len:274 (-) Transcript_24536:774-1595(-)
MTLPTVASCVLTSPTSKLAHDGILGALPLDSSIWTVSSAFSTDFGLTSTASTVAAPASKHKRESKQTGPVPMSNTFRPLATALMALRYGFTRESSPTKALWLNIVWDSPASVPSNPSTALSLSSKHLTLLAMRAVRSKMLPHVKLTPIPEPKLVSDQKFCSSKEMVFIGLPTSRLFFARHSSWPIRFCFSGSVNISASLMTISPVSGAMKLMGPSSEVMLSNRTANFVVPLPLAGTSTKVPTLPASRRRPPLVVTACNNRTLRPEAKGGSFDM